MITEEYKDMTPTDAYAAVLRYAQSDHFDPNPIIKHLEQIISTDAAFSYLLAVHTIGGRFDIGEAAIADHSYYAFLYAKYIIGGKWEMGEAAILRNARISVDYAIEVLGARWIDAEPIISKTQHRDTYENWFNLHIS